LFDDNIGKYGEGIRYDHRMLCTENKIAKIIYGMKNMSWKYHSQTN